jgi:hypothetical protein
VTCVAGVDGEVGKGELCGDSMGACAMAASGAGRVMVLVGVPRAPKTAPNVQSAVMPAMTPTRPAMKPARGREGRNKLAGWLIDMAHSLKELWPVRWRRNRPRHESLCLDLGGV